ncbi:uncharacterized protein C8R40DRAFT_1169020 [Lentinula edodes]|uniref:uncharacterized protein n=1 Tax=Lentinula edodes TaxID=5353 RepID=UPI001E8D86DB|nr:uncharacterized protein C8R40DRAFT_1169020 [Lentinula edodes]KAH7877096.1 hypothetical protein C8R40DRAFT_1169020 [Lentinula edodes]
MISFDREALSTPPQKRKLDAVDSDTESKILSSPPSRRRLGTSPTSFQIKKVSHQGPRKSAAMDTLLPSAGIRSNTWHLDGTIHTLDRLRNQTYRSTIEPPSCRHRKRSILPTHLSTDTTARHMRILSRHIKNCQISMVSVDEGRENSAGEISLTRIPSIMDVYLDAKSPSIDFTEEVVLEIADRSRRLSLHSDLGFTFVSSQTQPRYSQHYEYPHTVNSETLSSLTSEVTGLNSSWEQIVLGKNVPQSGKFTRHPDSFERSTSTWSEGLNGQ